MPVLFSWQPDLDLDSGIIADLETYWRIEAEVESALIIVWTEMGMEREREKERALCLTHFHSLPLRQNPWLTCFKESLSFSKLMNPHSI